MRAVVFHEFGKPTCSGSRSSPIPPGRGRGRRRGHRLGAQPPRRRRQGGRLALPDRASPHARRGARRPHRGARGGRRGGGRSATASPLPHRDVRRCVYCRTGRESLCTAPAGSSAYGLRRLRRALTCKKRAAHPIPDGVTDEAAAASTSRSERRGTCSSRGRRCAGRDGARQLGRQRHRLGGRAGREARGRVRDRHVEPRRQAREGEGARARRRHRLHAQDVVEEVLRHTDGEGSTSSTSTSAGSSSRRGSTRSRRTAGS